jgi:LuxR family maltose regulon positive regulatory protein
MTRTTPAVDAAGLHELDAPAAIPLDSPAWRDWLADERHQTFHYRDPAGGFTARKERKQRGGWYWVAYRQVRGKLHKTYLGKAETLTGARLAAASAALSAAGSGATAGD